MESRNWIFFLGALLCCSQIHAEKPIYKAPEIYSLNIVSDVKFRFATTLITSRVKNPHPDLREASFDVTLPNEAFISDFTIEIDGQIINGEVKEKEVAKEQYQAAQQRGESAGYIGTKGRETNRFTLSVSVAPESKVTFNLTYQELLKRQHGYYEQVIFIDPGQIVPEMEVTVNILESREITRLSVPPMSNDINFDLDGSMSVVTQPTPKSAYVKYIPSVEAQADQSQNGVAGKFIVRYDVDREMDAGDVLLVNGYFVHFFAPDGLEPLPNDVLFILDTSGSMSGTKIQQLKDAMFAILRDMHEGDRINIMTFSGSFRFWKDEMMNIADEDVNEEVKTYVRGLQTHGSTDIEGALRHGLRFLSEHLNSSETRTPIIVFLTDGEATKGETSTDNILQMTSEQNSLEIPIFTLAFGRYADYDLVKKIAIQNNGIGRKIYDGSDADIQITGFYSEIAVTLLSNITFSYLDAPVEKVTNTHFMNYFNGSELVVSGVIDEDYYAFENDTEIEISSRFLSKFTVRGRSRSGPSVLVITDDLVFEDVQSENLTSVGDYEKITEKVWAYMTIKQLLDKKLATTDPNEATSLGERILSLSLRYGFVTPLTSMVVSLPTNETTVDKDETIPLVNIETDVQKVSQKTKFSRRPLPQMAYSSFRDAVMMGAGGHGSGHFQGRKPVKDSGVPHWPSVARSPPLSLGLYGVGETPPSRRRAHPILTAQRPPKNDQHRNQNGVSGRVVSKMARITPNNKRHRGKKDRKKKRKERKTLPAYPLMLNLPSTKIPICFRLHSMLDDNEHVFRLLSDSNSNIMMAVKKKQNSTEEVKLMEILVFDSNSPPLSIKSKQTTGSETLNTTVEGLRVMVRSFKDGSLSVHASVTDESCTHQSPCGNGVLSNILSKAVKLGKKSNNRKMITIDGRKIRLNIKKTRFGRCWEMPKLSEEVFSFETVKTK